MAVAEAVVHFYFEATIRRKPRYGPPLYFEIELFSGYEHGFDRADVSVKANTLTPPVLPRIYDVGHQPED